MTRGTGVSVGPHRPSLTIRQGLIALEADLEPERAVKRARILQHRHVQHRHLGHHLAGSRLKPELGPGPRLRPVGSAGQRCAQRLPPPLWSEMCIFSARLLQIAGLTLWPITVNALRRRELPPLANPGAPGGARRASPDQSAELPLGAAGPSLGFFWCPPGTNLQRLRLGYQERGWEESERGAPLGQS